MRLRPPAVSPPAVSPPAVSEPPDAGQITVLMLMFAGVALVIIMIAVDASLVFLGRQRLASAVDGAAVRAAQQVDDGRYYTGKCVESLPLDAAAVATALAAYSTAGVQLRADPVTVDGGPGVVVTGRLDVQLPRIPVIKVNSWMVTYQTRARSSVSGKPCG
ncbi:MAG: Tad domain-containing protein [Actinomycetota bacterium]